MVDKLVQEGYSVLRVCQALEFPRSSYYRKRRKSNKNEGDSDPTTNDRDGNGSADENKEPCMLRGKKRRSDELATHVEKRTEKICNEHPFWGTRRVMNWLRKREGLTVNRKRIQRIMRQKGLTVIPKRKKASRESGRRKPVATRIHQWWGIDMTKFLVDELGWIYLVAVVDWFSRKVVGYSVDRHCRTEVWTRALEQAVLIEFPDGSRERNLFLMSDNGSQPTSKKFLNLCSTLGIQPTFTSYNNPKGNANTERWFRTLKEDCIWIHEWESYRKVQNDIQAYIDFYNNDYVHSALEWMSPNEYCLVALVNTKEKGKKYLKCEA